MGTFYMMVGLPGSGKSTWAKKYLLTSNIFSSDAYREKLFGDVTDQTHNDKVFRALYDDMRKSLSEGHDVVLDATNINRKNRSHALNEISGIDCRKICVVVATPIEVVKRQNASRDRVVPEEVIDRMLKQFEVPFEGEGFDQIILVDNTKEDSPRMSDIVNQMDGFNQNNPHHSLSLLEHCKECSNIVKEEMLPSVQMSDTVGFTKSQALFTASCLHDIGKLFTKTTGEDGVSHYYNHENVGAYVALTSNIDILPGLVTPSNSYKLLISRYINYHMIPYVMEKGMSEKKIEKIKEQFGDDWKYIEIIHKGDVGAH